MSGGIAGQKGDTVNIPRFLLEDSPVLAQRIKKFEGARDKALAAVALAGKAENIASLEEKASAELDKQEQITRDACAESERLIAGATAEAARITERAQSKAEQLTGAVNQKLSEAEQQRSDAAEIRKKENGKAEQVASQQAAVDAKEQSLNQRAAELDQRVQELVTEKAKFADLGEHIKSALG